MPSGSISYYDMNSNVKRYRNLRLDRIFFLEVDFLKPVKLGRQLLLGNAQKAILVLHLKSTLLHERGSAVNLKSST